MKEQLPSVRCLVFDEERKAWGQWCSFLGWVCPLSFFQCCDTIEWMKEGYLYLLNFILKDSVAQTGLITAVVKVDRRIRWHYTTTILRLRIGARLTKYRNCKFHNFARTISRHTDGISRYSVPPSPYRLVPAHFYPWITVYHHYYKWFENEKICFLLFASVWY